MTAHDHRERVAGCHRCELGADEAESAMRHEMADLEAEIDRLRSALNGIAHDQCCTREQLIQVAADALSHD